MATQSDLSGRRRALLVLVASLSAVLGPVATARPALADVTFDQKVLELINQERATAGVGSVQASPVLSAIAGPGPYSGCGAPIGGRANDMGARNYFSHTILNCGGKSVFDILSSTAGLVYSAAGENIAWMNGTTDPLVAAQRLMNDLMSSPTHRANILDGRFNQVGIGSWRSPSGQTWTGASTPLTNVWIVAQVFAQIPPSTGPVATAAPSNLSFGDRSVGSSAPAQTVTIRNTGAKALAVSSTSVAGVSAADFPVGLNTCGANVAAGAACTIAVGFAPSTIGLRSGTLTISTDAVGSPLSVPLSGVGVGAPLSGTPDGVAATGGDGRLSVTWRAPTSGAVPVGYGVWVYNAGGFTGKYAWVCGTCNSAEISGLVNGGQHYALVYASNGTAWSANGGVSNAVWVLSVPTAPINPRMQPGDGSMTMTWSATDGPGSGVDGYGLFVYDASGYTGKSAWVCSTCTSATATGLLNGGAYYGIVYAHNANGWGAALVPSVWVVVGTPNVPPGVLATKGNGSVTVSWTASPAGGAPIIGYGVFVYDSAGYTGKQDWVCATCTSSTISGLRVGTEHIVLVYGFNKYGWGLPGYSNSLIL